MNVGNSLCLGRRGSSERAPKAKMMQWQMQLPEEEAVQVPSVSDLLLPNSRDQLSLPSVNDGPLLNYF